ncbi:GntR family transcriptional regulator [Angustibacter aerolatus]
MLRLDLDRTSPLPLWSQLAEQLAAAVDDGRLAPGDGIENEVALAARLGVSRPTVRRAIGDLVAQGLLVRQRGVGTQVASRMVHRRARLTSLYDDLAREGRTPTTQVLAVDPGVQDARACAALGLEPGTPLLRVDRLRLAGGEPLALMRNWLPPRFADLSRDDLEGAGLYTLLRERGGQPTVARQQLGARAATAAEARQLGTRRGAALLTMTRTAFDAAGEGIELGDHCYRSEHYSVEVVVAQS